MTPPAITAELVALARRIVWFEPPSRALDDPVRFLAYLMTYGTEEDIAVAQRHFSEADFREAVERLLTDTVRQNISAQGVEIPREDEPLERSGT